jgi:hypothetical protein
MGKSTTGLRVLSAGAAKNLAPTGGENPQNVSFCFCKLLISNVNESVKAGFLGAQR